MDKTRLPEGEAGRFSPESGCDTVRARFSPMSEEKRNRTRINAGFEAYVIVDDVITPVETRDLSLKGALLRGFDQGRTGESCQLHIPLSPSVRIVAECTIVRIIGDDVAVSFTEMDELSFTTLRRTVQLNADDAEVIDDELLIIFTK